jgi:RNA polymerase primary sigma factor
MGVAVYEQAPDAETLMLNDTAPSSVSDDQADKEAEVALSTVDSELTRAGEIEMRNATKTLFRR